MKQQTNIQSRLQHMVISLFCGLVFILALSCSDQGASQQVFEAYELRVSGHADSALAMLEGIVKEQPDLAIAWYELARATMHTGMQSPQQIKETLEKAGEYIARAVENDPDNALYLSYKGGIETLQFYMALQMGQEGATDHLVRMDETYNAVFELDPTYYEDKLTLVEFYGLLPEDMGGDKEKAEKYAAELEASDLISGAKAREILMPDDADYEAYWKGILEKVPDNADAIQALGRVYLFEGDFDEAAARYQQAIDLDPSKNILYLDLGRYQLMQAMQNPAVLDSVGPLVKTEFDKYLNSSPKPLNPMKAWAYSKLAMIAHRTGDPEKAEGLMEKAKQLDPYHSQAFGTPGMDQYCPPDQVIHEQRYYMSPF